MRAINAFSLLDTLVAHIGQKQGLTAQQLARKCLGGIDTGLSLQENLSRMPTSKHLRDVRYAVRDLRNQGVHICGHPSTGYYIAENAAELDATCEFLYSRALSSLVQISNMKRIALPDLRGQLRLPT